MSTLSRQNLAASHLLRALELEGLTVTTIESYKTSGIGLAQAITNMYTEGVVKDTFVICELADILKLGVPKEITERYCINSIKTAEAMAKAGKQANNNPDVVIAITGHIEPNSPDDRDPIVAYVAVAFQDKIFSRRFFVDVREYEQSKSEVVIQAMALATKIIDCKKFIPATTIELKPEDC